MVEILIHLKIYSFFITYYQMQFSSNPFLFSLGLNNQLMIYLTRLEFLPVIKILIRTTQTTQFHTKFNIFSLLSDRSIIFYTKCLCVMQLCYKPVCLELSFMIFISYLYNYSIFKVIRNTFQYGLIAIINTNRKYIFKYPVITLLTFLDIIKCE